MNKKEDLIALIKSLSKTEKRYFKLFVSKNAIGESNHYLKLFNVIEKAGTADKKGIQEHYGSDDFIQKQYRTYKHLLYKQILKSLRSYHSEKSVDDNILELIRDAKILYDKTLYNDAEKVLEKAKNLAYKYEKYTFLPQIVRWQKKIFADWSIYNNTSGTEILQLFEEEMLIVHQMGNVNEYIKLKALIFLSYRINGEARTQNDIDRYNNIIDVPALKIDEVTLSYEAKKEYYGIYLIYFTAINNIKEAYKYGEKLVTLMEAHPHQIEDDPLAYSKVLHNFLFAAKELKKYEEFFNIIPKLKSLLISFNIRSSVLLRICHLEIVTYIEIGQFKKAELLLPEVEVILMEMTNKDEMLELFVNFGKATLFLGREKYSKALAFLNIIQNDNKIYIRQDHHSFAKILQLIIHFEKENNDLLPYLVRSVYRDLLKRNKLHKTESIFIGFIRTKLNNIRSSKDQIEAFKALKEELIEICNDHMEARFLELFDIISWLESKIENRSFEEVLREKSGYVLKEI